MRRSAAYRLRTSCAIGFADSPSARCPNPSSAQKEPANSSMIGLPCGYETLRWFDAAILPMDDELNPVSGGLLPAVLDGFVTGPEGPCDARAAFALRCPVPAVPHYVDVSLVGAHRRTRTVQFLAIMFPASSVVDVCGNGRPVGARLLSAGPHGVCRTAPTGRSVSRTRFTRTSDVTSLGSHWPALAVRSQLSRSPQRDH